MILLLQKNLEIHELCNVKDSIMMQKLLKIMLSIGFLNIYIYPSDQGATENFLLVY